jgi:hypothetical protein
MNSLWPHVRAAFVLFHVVAITLMALPAPGGGIDRKQWADPTVQGEFKAWNARFGRFGLVMTEKEFEDRLYVAARAVMDGREIALAPFQPYYRYCNTYQSWRMFVAPHTFPERLQIEIERDGAWEVAFLERDPDRVWLRTELEHDRLRSLIFRAGWRKYRKSFSDFADWTARQARRDFPDATRLRMRFWKQRSPTPEEARAGIEPEGSWDDEMVRDLRDRR